VVIDSSALVAFLEGGAETDRIMDALLHASRLLISTASVVEAGIVVETRRGESGGRELDLLLHRMRVEQVPVSPEHAELARAAYRRFGKERHPARLNFGDCFAYALAQPLAIRCCSSATTSREPTFPPRDLHLSLQVSPRHVENGPLRSTTLV
jgi:ribonuclease VapC